MCTSQNDNTKNPVAWTSNVDTTTKSHTSKTWITLLKTFWELTNIAFTMQVTQT